MEQYLPNADLAYVEPAKVRDYLLVYRRLDDKSGFFVRFGFRRDQWPVLEDALLQHARSAPIASVTPIPNGVKYALEGPLKSPDARNPMVASVWEITANAPNPRFITARPARRRP